MCIRDRDNQSLKPDYHKVTAREYLANRIKRGNNKKAR
ncbi:hypothetical Protein YC6258_01568 [Gynuella sunshinyii YC6258]|uniref:Uncharacterized protein n=1 Tax=Gynuella sunshinyii YC6258 TaxID=1445510 RepID=A0A0C5VH94_9GAMM|nr:hypothetical Protein YC6258_01568 [Gynuella sunshinyii YC6258]